MKKNLKEEIEIPDGVEVKINDGMVTAKGPKGEVSRRMVNKKLNMRVEGRKIVVSANNSTKREKRMAGTFIAHMKNMIKGVKENYVYKLKACSSHFPMTVELKNKVFSVSNFLGEKVARKITIKDGVNVKIEGEIITVESPDKELAGSTASAMEEACKIRDKDRRIFQDGIYMILKAGKDLK